MDGSAIDDNHAGETSHDEQLRSHPDYLTRMAARYIWWMTPAEAVEYPRKVVAQVMNIGVFEDAMGLITEFGADILSSILRRAEAGQFNERSWHFWHYRLGLSQPGEVPPLPVRRFE